MPPSRWRPRQFRTNSADLAPSLLELMVAARNIRSWAAAEVRYVGHLKMSSICEEILMQGSMQDRCVWSTRVCDMKKSASGGWSLRGISRGAGGEPTEIELGRLPNWVVAHCPVAFPMAVC